jgi:putative nucleotidyltransferase with HDIG domain
MFLRVRQGMNTLKIKFLGLTATILLIAVGLTTWYNLKTQEVMLSKVANEHSRLLVETIRNSIITDMASGRNDRVGQILAKINNEPAIDSIRIFDESGRVLMSAHHEEIGDLVSTSELLAYRTGRYNFHENANGLNQFNSLVPIYNSPDCYSCHEESERVLGILTLRLSLDSLSSMRFSGRNATMVSSGVMLALLVLAMSAFLLIYVDRPIRKLVKAMEYAEKGDFAHARAPISSSDEMTLLSNKFNLMVQRLREIMDTSIRNERDLAISQEKLAHSEEIQTMNMALEERLREIEYLNITLEERIEEIEEANYKIADLASELEDKNVGLKSAVERLQALYQTGLVINSTVEIPKLLDILSQKGAEILKAKIAYILMLNPDSGGLVVGGAQGLADDIDISEEIPAREGGVCNWVIKNKQPLLIVNIEESKEFSKISQLGFARESVVCAPLVENGYVIGTITVANPLDGSPFTNSDLDLLGTIAAQASVAIRNARLYEEQQKTYLTTVQALVSAIEASDAYTRGHSDRVTRYSIALAKKIGYDMETISRLEQAAILHDIGKIGIDMNLLHKKEKLTQADFDVLKLHPSIGVRILEPISFLDPVRNIIEQHHERFDGKGYPNGLAGHESLAEARILAVCDTFDAMTSDRPYRNALPADVAIQEIKDHAGSQFDPDIAEAFVALYKEEGLPC